MELFYTPASKLDTFVAKCLHPHKECKEEVLEAVRTVKKFLWQQCFPGKNVPDCGSSHPTGPAWDILCVGIQKLFAKAGISLTPPRSTSHHLDQQHLAASEN